jgi:heme-degrading monooxygenase HmoA
MFSVIFEVRPQPEQWETYLGLAKMLRPELEQIDGFVDNIRFRSLTRDGWILSLSNWRDEKAVVRWRTRMRHHEVQERGRNEVLLDYHLRVGEVTRDSCLPAGYTLREERFDETEIGLGTTATLIDGKAPEERTKQVSPDEIAQGLGRPSSAQGLVAWDIFEAVFTPGDMILLLSWWSHEDAERFDSHLSLPQDTRLRRVRVIRDYSLSDRREAPQYYPEVTRTAAKNES